MQFQETAEQSRFEKSAEKYEMMTLLNQAFSEGYSYGREGRNPEIISPESVHVISPEKLNSFYRKYVSEWMKGWDAGARMLICEGS